MLIPAWGKDLSGFFTDQRASTEEKQPISQTHSFTYHVSLSIDLEVAGVNPESTVVVLHVMSLLIDNQPHVAEQTFPIDAKLQNMSVTWWFDVVDLRCAA